MTTANTDPANSLSLSMQNLLPDIGLGGLLGVATGVAVRMIGRVALLVIGLVFIAVQLLAAFDIVTVDWLKLQALTQPWLSHSGENLASWFSRVILTKLPFTGSFIVGFLLGIRMR